MNAFKQTILNYSNFCW